MSYRSSFDKLRTSWRDYRLQSIADAATELSRGSFRANLNPNREVSGTIVGRVATGRVINLREHGDNAVIETMVTVSEDLEDVDNLNPIPTVRARRITSRDGEDPVIAFYPPDAEASRPERLKAGDVVRVIERCIEAQQLNAKSGAA